MKRNLFYPFSESIREGIYLVDTGDDHGLWTRFIGDIVDNYECGFCKIIENLKVCLVHELIKTEIFENMNRYLF